MRVLLAWVEVRPKRVLRECGVCQRVKVDQSKPSGF